MESLFESDEDFFTEDEKERLAEMENALSRARV